MDYMQRILNPSQYRSNGNATLTKENFARAMVESIGKAISSQELPPKEKHVRKLLIGTFQTESAAFFWQYLPVLRLKEDQIICWKFCYVLHKILRDGHQSALTSCFGKRQILLDCGNLWRHCEDGYGQLIFKYVTLLYNRINFLVRNNRFPNDLKVTDEQLEEIGEHDPSIFFDLSCEIFDALDDILRLQESVLLSVETKRLNSMSNAGRCHLAPLVACIQDSSLLYDYSVKILFKLHGTLPASTLEGHRERFLSQHKLLKNFYLNASNLQYFKTLIQIPYLTDRPPNFLVASDLKQHVAPQVVMIESQERDSPDQMSSMSDANSQILVNFMEDAISTSADRSLETNVDHSMEHSQHSIDAAFGELLVNSTTNDSSNELSARVEELESKILELRNELELERASHETTKLELSNRDAAISALVKSHETEAKKFKDEIRSLRCEVSSTKSAFEKLQEECKRAQHDNEISQGVMKKLVKDMSELRNESANSRSTSQPTGANPESNLAKDQVEQLTKKVNELNAMLNERENQSQEWLREREQLLSSKSRLEQQLDSNQEDLLMAEMNETDRIIKEAWARIEELSEKSRKEKTGIELQVNEKISEVCWNLMKAVRNLIIQSKLLQREVVGEDGKTNNNDFYKKNSSWTEGLLSAANVVAMAARSLVDSADRALSGQARYSELAASAHEIAAATTQLVVASRVKANKDSQKLKVLTSAAKQVNLCTSNVVDTARVCAQIIEQEVDKVEITSLSLHQTKKLEMETQVKLLELEDQLSKERVKLGLLRKQHYEQEEAQLASAAGT